LLFSAVAEKEERGNSFNESRESDEE